MRNVKRKYRMHDKVYREKERQMTEYIQSIFANSRHTPEEWTTFADMLTGMKICLLITLNNQAENYESSFSST